MFDIGWTEMLVIAVVMIVVVGPKDLPRMLRTFGKMTTKVRGMAGDFQKQFNDALKEAELDDVKKSVDALRGLNPAAEIRKQLNPFEKAAADVRAGLDNAMKPKPSVASEPASSVVHEAEPLKTGAADMPGAPEASSLPEMPPPGPVTAGPAAPATMIPVDDPAGQPAEVVPAPVPAPVVARKPRASAKPATLAAPSVEGVSAGRAPRPKAAAKPTLVAKTALPDAAPKRSPRKTQ